MNLAHLHLLLNHFPTLGFGSGIGLFLLSLVLKNDILKQLGLGVLFVMALVAIPVYETGVAAAETISGLPGVSNTLIAAHEDAALLAFVFMEITGAVAWLGLWQFRRISRATRGNVSAVLLFSMVTLGLMLRASNLGGDIRHPEIRFDQETTPADATAASGTGWLKSASVKSFVIDQPWVWPACETVHFIGLCLSFGVVLLANLRMLGMMKNVSFAALHRLLPWGILGFGINLITGMLFFIGAPEQYTRNVAFYWKMAFLMVAGVNVLYFTAFDEAWAVRSGDDAPVTAKVIAASTIFLWVGVIYFGRMLPYIGNAF
jgi:hypothetical protein